MQNTTIGVTMVADMDVSKVLGAVKEMEGSLKGLKLPDDIGGNLKKNLSSVTDLLKKYQSQLEKPINTKADAKAITKTATEIESVFNAIESDINELSSRQIYLKTDLGPLNELKSRLAEIRTEYQKSIQEIGKNSGVYDAIGALEKAASRSSLTLGSLGVAKNAFNKGDLEGYANAIDEVYNRLAKLSEGTIGKAAKGLGIDIIGSDGQLKAKATLLEEIRTKLTALQKVDLTGTNAENLLKDVEQLSKELANADAAGLKNAQQAVSQIGETANGAASGFQAMSQEADKFVQSTLSAAQQVQQLQQSTQYFFSLRNMINLLKRGVQDAIETVKELDAAMTQTAVVTDFSVGDMWEKLPEYTANANALGASVKDMYEATTLYYQQGLNSEQSMAIASETMKMARIGGLEAADATDKMTAALRGFNMELNEASAQHVNDVYSNLAAKTASDTKELGTAMQRTASIAASAGMSFEGTAAFLAQAIETTREPAENLGTAMKTIVARFTELKKNPLEISEVDGEEVDYNKVDTALKSIGVSLKDTNGQFRELDQVFLDIAQRWDSLSQTQQRYVATTAAGSRQQSRFIAMMSNYDRTVQLMDYANNSAGASNEQFGKTMESLEAKLNKLRNAWDQFEMGIANNSIIKGAVDGLTGILDITNSLIDTFSLGIGPLKSFLSLFAAFTGLKAGGKFVNSLIGGLGGLVDPTSSFGKGFWGANTVEGKQNTGLAGKISTPIVAKLNELIAVTKGTKAEKAQTTSTVGQYKDAFAKLRNPSNLNMSAIDAIFKDLSDEHAYAAYKSTPGTADAMQQATLGWLNSKQMPADAQKTGQQLMKAIFKGMGKKEISVKDGIKLLGQPQKWGQYFGTDVAQNFSNSFSKELTKQAHANTLYSLGLDPKEYEVGSSALVNLLKNDEDLRKAYVQNFSDWKQTLGEESIGEFNEIPIEPTKYQQFANSIGMVGSKFTAAGMSIQMFGAQLSQLSPALQGIGSLLIQVGSAASTFGMGFSGLGKIVNNVGKRVAAGMATAQAAKMGVTALGPAMPAQGLGLAKAFMSGFTGGMSAGPIAAIIAGVLTGGIMIAKSIADKKAKEAGEEVRKNFEEGFTKNEEKIQSINDIKGRFEELSKGVDQFGHNVDLSNEEYNEYLSLSRELSQISPSLIAGYNAEGEAILKTGAALDEVIDKLKEKKQLTLENYIDDSSVDKLIKEFKTTDAYKDNRSRTDAKGEGRGKKAFQSQIDALKNANAKADLDFDVADAIEQLGGGEVSDLSSLTNAQLNFVAQHYSDILSLIKEENAALDEEAEVGLQEAFGNIGGAIEDVMTEGQPIIDAMQQWMGQESLDAVGLGLGEEFSSSFTEGFNSIMTQSLLSGDSSEVMKGKLRDYANGWKQLAGDTSQYSKIIEQASKKQDDYLKHIGEKGAIDNYKSSVETLAQKLEQLAKAQDTSTAAGKAFAEQCLQQANALRNYATEGAMSLGEALNVLSGKFTEARGAQERFQKATEGGDYYTAAEGFRSIAETVLDEKNVAGDGSLTAWTGAEALLGQQYVDTHSWDEIATRVQEVNTLFEDGAEGVYNFNDMLVEAVNSGKDLSAIGKVVDGEFEFKFDDVENLQECADLLGISEDVLAGMIDKARQFAAFNVGNNAQIRQALEQSEQAMIGQSYGNNGKSNLYMSESAFRQEAYQQGIRGDDYVKTKEDLTNEQNVQFLTADTLAANEGDLGFDKVLKDIGLDGADKTLDNSVAALTKMGFDLEEQKKILSSDGIKLADGEATEEEIEQAYQEQEFETENPTVAGIADDTGVIASAATAMLAQMGILTDQAKQDIEAQTSEEQLEGYKDLLNPKGGFEDSASRDAARGQVLDQIAKYDETLTMLKNSDHSEALQPYIDMLESAKAELQGELDSEADRWVDQLSEAADIVKGIGTGEEADFLQSKAVDIEAIYNSDDVMSAAASLRSLSEEGKLSHATMKELAQDFLTFHAQDLLSLDSSSFDQLCMKLRIGKTEAIEFLQTLQTPFVLTGKLEGENLTNYINNFEGLTDTEKHILLAADTTGEEKVQGLIDAINQEFGDGSEETKLIILEAEAKLASGDQEGAEKLLADAGFKEGEIKKITQQLSITVNGSVANKDEVQQALNEQLEGMDLEAEAKAKISATLQIKDQAKASNQTATVNYTKGSQAQASDSSAKVNYTTVGKQAKPEDKSAGVDYTWKSQDNPKDKVAYVTYKERKRGQNYSIPAHQSISFGAAADGLNVPNKKKHTTSTMTALVGEEGYEVGYIPSEQRSVIFGANGPELTSFPKDTIIYPHGISEDIVRRGKQKHPEMGSHVNGRLPKRPTSGGSGSSGGGSGSSGSGSGNGSGSSEAAEEAAAAVTELAGRVEVWWENMGRRVDATQKKIDDALDLFEKKIKGLNVTARSINKVVTSYQKNLKTSIALNKAEVRKAKRELNALDYSTDKFYSEAEISYTVKEDDKDSTQKETVDLSSYIRKNKKYGTYEIDQAAVQAVADQNKSKAEAIIQAAEKAINDRLSKQKTAEDNIKKAQDALEKLTQEIYDTFYGWETSLTKIWNLTQKIEAVQSKISRTDAATKLFESQMKSGEITSDTQSAAENLKLFEQKLKQQNELVKDREKAIDQAKQDVTDAFKKTDEQAEIKAIKDKLKKDKDATAEIKKLNNKNKVLIKGRAKRYKILNNKKASKKAKDKAREEITSINAKITENRGTINEHKKSQLDTTQKLGLNKRISELQAQTKLIDEAQKFVTVTRNADGTVNIDLNADKLQAEKLAGNLSEDRIKAIEEYVNGIKDASDQLNDLYTSLTEDINQYYENLIELQDQWVDYGEQLVKFNEEKNKKELDRLKKLSDAINKALKDLLDEVKRKLTERRQQEDNRKTEEDISKKQQRLAMLRADTSGGHQVEIAQLEKEIADAQQNYQRTLEDQLLDKLQNQADEAAKQRDHQIQLQEALVSSVNNIAQVNEWLARLSDENITEEEVAAIKEEMRIAYRDANDYDESIAPKQEQIDRQFEGFFDGLRTNQKKQDELTKAINGLKDTIEKVKEAQNNLLLNTTNAKEEHKLNVAEAFEQIPGVTYKELKEQGKYTAQDFKNANISAQNARSAGFTAKELLDAGYDPKELRDAGYTAQNFKDSKATIEQAQKAGFKGAELASAYGASKAMRLANVGGRTAQKATKIGATSLQKIINQSKDDAADQKDMAGVTAKMDTNGKRKAGGTITGTIGTSGTQIAVNRGSTLYVQQWNTKTGKAAGHQKTYPIGKLTNKLIQQHPIEAKQALLYAIRNQAWGSKINKNFSSLVDAAKLAGTEVKLNQKGHNWKASIGKGGIFQDMNKTGVAKWNPATGKQSLEKYNAKNFKNRAKNNEFGREYAQVLKKHGVKGYATGGIADFTGPAWLDGTPSKPELVLNAADTKNFLALRDVLSNVMGSINSTSSASYGDMSYQININVDHINNDYDVDKIAERVKKNIVKDASYRNVTQVRSFR